jgi:hypothetical protein
LTDLEKEGKAQFAKERDPLKIPLLAPHSLPSHTQIKNQQMSFFEFRV